MKRSWKKMITGLMIAAILSGHVGTASAGIFTSVVKKAAGVAIKQAAPSSTLRKAAGVAAQTFTGGGSSSLSSRVLNKAKDVITNNPTSLSGRVLNKAKEVVTNNPNSLTGKILNKAKTAVADPTSLTSRVLNRAQNAANDSNSLTGKLLNKAKIAVNDPTSLTSRVLNRAKTAGNDPNSLTSRLLNRAQKSVNDPNSLTGKILTRAATAGNDPNSLTSRILNKAKGAAGNPNGLAARIIDKTQVAAGNPKDVANLFIDGAKGAAKDPTGIANRVVDKLKGTNGIANIQGIVAGDNLVKDKLLKDRLVEQIKKAIQENGGLDVAEVAAQAAADAVNGNGAVDAADVNQNGQNDQLVGQLLKAGIQAGNQLFGSTEASSAEGFAAQGGGFASAGFVPEPVIFAEPVGVPAEEIAPQAPIAAIDLELYDLRRVEAGNDEQGPLYRVIVKNLSGIDVTSEMTIALLASMEQDSDDNVSVLGSLGSIKSRTAKTVELRLPQGSDALTFLTAVVALTEGADANETDNVATFERDAVLAVR